MIRKDISVYVGAYIPERKQGYPDIRDQLDALWHDINNGLFGENAKTGLFFTTISEVKAKYPKPE